MITEVKQSKTKENVEYIEPIVLKEKKTVVTRAHLMRIGHGDEVKEVSLKIGRYNKPKVGNSVIKSEELENKNPKSRLTLDDEELEKLVDYLNQNYYPLRADENKYISLSKNQLSLLVDNKKNIVKEIVELAIEKGINLEEIKNLIEIKNRKKALELFVEMMKENAVESKWQEWFQKNNWVLGSDFIGVSDDRRIDESNIADFIAQSIDGYIDVIEIKRPIEAKEFFENKKDHNNLIPSTSLVKAITQLENYLTVLEEKANNIDITKRIGKILKPRGILIFGRSNNWSEDDYESFRILNASIVNITILTYDMVFQRAKKMNEYLSSVDNSNND